jgi:hypothetical protein
MTRRCGPVAVAVSSLDEALCDVANAALDLCGRRWPETARSASIELRRQDNELRSSGRFLSCARMRVDRLDRTFTASTQSGMVARGTIGDATDRWEIHVPVGLDFGEPEIGDVEDLVGLACTIAWRSAGWIPVHAGAVARGEKCAILCAPSGGGKSTLTTALLHEGWSTLGDDKLLLRCGDDGPVVAALLETFNLHPRTSAWFGGLEDIESLPRYSAWTEKRRVTIESISKDAARFTMKPTHVVRLMRDGSPGSITAEPMPPADVLPTLLKQVVIPHDAEAARHILRVVSTTAASLRGLVLHVGDDAYASAGWANAIDEALCR